MRACQISCSYDCTKVMWVFYLIKHEYKWVFALASCRFKYIFNLSIFVSCTYGNYPLMMSCVGKPV